MGWLELVASPSEEPLTVEDAQAQVRRFDGDDIQALTDLIAEARQRIEDVTNRQVMGPASYRLHLDHLRYVDRHGCLGIEIPKPPLVAGSVVITYRDTAGDWQTLDAGDYVVETPSGPTAGRAWIRPTSQAAWPSTWDEAGSVRVAFSAGYGDAAAVPRSLKRAMKLTLSHWFQNDSAVVVGTIASELPQGLRSLWAPYISRQTQAH